MNNFFFFALFICSILSILIIDLQFIGKSKHVISLKESAILTTIWVLLAIGFYFIIYFYGEQIHRINNINALFEYKTKFAPYLKIFPDNYLKSLLIYRKSIATDYLTGYLMEYTLSIDNIFIIMIILTGFSVDPKNYKHVLFWGILGAIVLRFLFIFTGAVLIQKFNWILLIFGSFLLYSGIKMVIDRNKNEKIDVKNHWLVKFLSRHFRITKNFEKYHFFVKKSTKFFITPLFVVLIIIEFTDLIFAFDSIPAIFSVTQDPCIVFFSNIFAILGLRSLFFLLIKSVEVFRFLKIGVSFLLAFVGFKLLFHNFLVRIGFKNVYSLFIILTTLILSILFSIFIPRKKLKHNLI